MTGSHGDALAAALHRVTDSLFKELDDLSHAISDQVGCRLEALVDWEDWAWRVALERSTRANIGAFLSTLTFGLPVASAGPPEGALDLVDHLAMDPDALPILLRTYQMGAAATWQLFLARTSDLVEDRDLLAEV